MSNAEQTRRHPEGDSHPPEAHDHAVVSVKPLGARERDPASSDAAIAIAYDLLRSTRIDDARSAFEQVLHRDQHNKAALLGLGHTFRHLKQLDHAEAQFRHLLALDPKHVDGLSGLAATLRSAERSEEALIALRGIDQTKVPLPAIKRQIAHLLRDLDRVPEALDAFRELVILEPDSAANAIGLARLLVKMRDRDAATQAFKAAITIDSRDQGIKIELAHVLREADRLDESETLLNAVLVEQPDNIRALNCLAHIFRRRGDHRAALHYFGSAADAEPGNAQALVELATENCALGQIRQAEQALDAALQLEPNQLGALLQLGELAALAGDIEHAHHLFRMAREAHPENIWPWLNAARVAFDAGDKDEAFSLIKQARENFRSSPELDAVEVDMTRKQRDLRGARAILQRADAAGLSSFWLSTHRIQIEISTSHYDDATALLADTRATNASERARVTLLRGQIAEAQYDYREAISHYREAIRLTPADGWAHMDLARVALMELDTVTARSELASFAKLSKSYLVPRGQSINPSQSHVGQLLEEFELDQSALAKLRQAKTLPFADQLQALRSIVQSYPDCTSAAITATIALRQSGRFLTLALPLENSPKSPIPQQIVQLWDTDPPSDVADLMSSWRQINPQYDWKCFSDAEARRFIGQTFPLSVLHAYVRARQPAQKADIFRLAYLTARGGIYADADDRCDAPLTGFLRSDATLVLHQETFATIGNNFIAVTAEHPVMQRALSLAVAAINRGDQDLIWLSTGPGLLTRAFCLEWAIGAQPGWLARAQIMSLGELQQVIGIHCPARYKTTDKHWSRASFARRNTR